MSNSTPPKSSGLDDIDIELGNISKTEELQQKKEQLDQYLESVNGSLTRVEQAIKDAETVATKIETATTSLTNSADKIQPALDSLVENAPKDARLQFTAQLSDNAIQQIQTLYNGFVEVEKTRLTAHLEEEKAIMAGFIVVQMMAFKQWIQAQKKAFDNHVKDMEYVKRYGEGIWLSKRTWDWILYSLIFLGAWFACMVTVAIIYYTKLR
jgi:chromosome segregation ATPase